MVKRVMGALRTGPRKTAKVTPAVNYFDTGFVVGMPGGGMSRGECHDFRMSLF